MSNKKIQIQKLETILDRTEENRASLAKMAINARRRGQLQDASRFAKQAGQLKKRIENVNSQITLLNEQVFALEEAGTFLVTRQELQSGTNLLTQVLGNDGDFQETIAESRRQLDASNAINEALRIDASVHDPGEDSAQMLEDLENEFGSDFKSSSFSEMTDVPQIMPRPPTASSSSAPPSEMEQIEARLLDRFDRL